MIPSIDIMQQYAPNVSPQTIAAIVQVESGGNQFALGINGPVKKRFLPRSVKQAAEEARYWIGKGYSVDLGLMQINSRNLRNLGITIEQAFDPGINIQAGAKILIRGYRGAVKRFGPGQDALKAALSAYNTGNYERGFRNGYVAKYFSGRNAKCINTIAITTPISTGKPVSASENSLRSLTGIIKRYHSELTIYSRDELPKMITSQDTSQLETPCAGLNVTELPAELSDVSGVYSQKLLY